MSDAAAKAARHAALIHRLVDVPFADCGRSEAGVDCWGLACLFYRWGMGVELPDLLGGYAHAMDAAAIPGLVAAESANWKQVCKPAWGRLVTMRIRGRPWHVGICIGSGKFIHIMGGLGVATERLDSPKWLPRIQGYWQYDPH